MGNYVDITGRRYGKLVVLGVSENRNISGDMLWDCQCDCGRTKAYTSGNLRNGDAKSCGCLRYIDYSIFINQKYGRLTILEFIENNKMVRVKCDCGIITVKKWEYIKGGKTKSCGCLGKEGRKGADLTGLKFGKLQVIELSNFRNKHKDALWMCLCECGNTKLCTTGALKHGGNISCGCMQGHPTHGDWNKRIRIIWVNMMHRCYKENNKQFINYGGRGIKVCKEWRDYKLFKLWAYNNGYNENLTLERIKVNKGYSPNNCKWATIKEQQNNRRNNTLVKINGITKTVAQWCDFYNIKQSDVYKRYGRGWSIKDSILIPKRKYGTN